MADIIKRFNPCSTDACIKQCDSMGVHCTEICIDEIERLAKRVKELEESEKRWIKQAADFELLAATAQKRADREVKLHKVQGEPVSQETLQDALKYGTLPLYTAELSISMPLFEAEMLDLAKRAVEAQKNDKRTDAKKIDDGVAFITDIRIGGV